MTPHRYLLVPLALSLLLPGPAAAHGDLESSIPAGGDVVRSVPDHLVLNFAEAPTKDARLTVVDGCGNDVVAAVEIEQRTAHVTISKEVAARGRWSVAYRIISAEDGHPSKGSYRFKVKGKLDCSQEGEGDEEPGDDTNDDGDPAAGGGATSSSSDFPWLPVLGGAVVLVLLAFVARSAATRR